MTQTITSSDKIAPVYTLHYTTSSSQEYAIFKQIIYSEFYVPFMCQKVTDKVGELIDNELILRQ